MPQKKRQFYFTVGSKSVDTTLDLFLNFVQVTLPQEYSSNYFLTYWIFNNVLYFNLIFSPKYISQTDIAFFDTLSVSFTSNLCHLADEESAISMLAYSAFIATKATFVESQDGNPQLEPSEIVFLSNNPKAVADYNKALEVFKASNSLQPFSYQYFSSSYIEEGEIQSFLQSIDEGLDCNIFFCVYSEEAGVFQFCLFMQLPIGYTYYTAFFPGQSRMQPIHFKNIDSAFLSMAYDTRITKKFDKEEGIYRSFECAGSSIDFTVAYNKALAEIGAND